jgi:hypothetical protein
MNYVKEQLGSMASLFKRVHVLVKQDITELMKTLKETFMSLGDKSKTLKEINYKTLHYIYEECSSLLLQTLRLSSIFMDSFILAQLEEYNESTDLFIFLGINHLFRIAHWLSLPIISTVDESLRVKALSVLPSFSKK